MRAQALVLFAIFALGSPTQASDGFYEQEGVQYYMAVGINGTGTATSGMDYAATTARPLDGCVIAKLRPDGDRGRVQVLTSLYGAPIQIESSTFDHIATAVRVDGTVAHGSVQHPAVETQVASWGEAVLTADGAVYEDPATGGAMFASSLYITEQGFRDDESGQVLQQDGSPYVPGGDGMVQEDMEAHLRIWSNGTGEGHTDEVAVPGGAFTEPYHIPADDYRNTHAFQNVRFGAQAVVSITGNTPPSAGLETQLQFTVRAPDGAILAQAAWNKTGTDIFPGFDSQHNFTLDRFGAYKVEVTGSSQAPFAYEIQFQQGQAPPLDLNLWWEEVALGSGSLAAQDACRDAISTESAPVTQAIPPRPEPPAFPVQTVLLTTLAVAAATLVMVKVAMMMRASGHAAEIKSRS